MFGSDGALYENYSLPSFQFSFTTSNEAANVISNQIQPLLRDTLMQQFYYAEFPRPSLVPLDVAWHLSTSISNTTTGYFVNNLGNPVPIGPYTSSDAKYIIVGSLVKFEPPPG